MKRRERLWAELTGVGVALALALIGLLHILLSSRAELMFYSGDSVLMPLIRNSMERGEAFQWVMSTTFFFPEIAQYLAVSALLPETHAALAASGVLNIMLLYGATRALTRSTLGALSARRQIAAALGGLGLFVALGFLENSSAESGSGPFEIFTLSFTLTYYSATIIATVVLLAIAAAWLRSSSWGTRCWLLVATAVISWISALSNPLYLVWAVAPVGVALGVLWVVTVFRRTILWNLIPFVAVMGLATGIGYRGRRQFSGMLGLNPDSYVHLGKWRYSVSSMAHHMLDRASTPAGIIGMAALIALGAWALYLGKRGLLHRDRPQAVLLLFCGILAVALPVGALLTGQDAPRYLQPMFLVPVLSLPIAIVALWPRTGAWTPSWLRRPGLITKVRIGTAVLTGALLLITGSIVGNLSYDRASCLENWLSEQDGRLVGAGGFWTGRSISAYLPDQVILQTLGASYYNWMTNLATYEQPAVDYVLVSDADSTQFGPSSAAEFLSVAGNPAHIVQCDGFDIWDYRGTPGQQVLYQRIIDTARIDRLSRFGT